MLDIIVKAWVSRFFKQKFLLQPLPKLEEAPIDIHTAGSTKSFIRCIVKLFYQ